MRRRLGALAAPVLLAGLAIAGPAAGATLFASDSAVAVPAKGVASPYPSHIDVQGQQGVVTDVVAGLRGVSHPAPGDLDILLSAPDGRSSILMSDACAGGPLTAANLVFTRIPVFEEMPATCGSGVYRPTDRSVAEADPEGWPGATGPFAADLGRLIGSAPNGQWALRVRDDLSPGSGTIARGWTLALETAVPRLRVPAAAGSGVASPYPAAQPVDTGGGILTDVDVRLGGVIHGRPDDLEVVLEAPSGQRVGLMLDVCGGGPAQNVTWVFDDDAPAEMPAQGSCASGHWKPTIVSEIQNLPAPAPAKPYGLYLSHLNYRVQDGEWRVWVHDDRPADADGVLVEEIAITPQVREPAAAFFLDGPVELAEGERGVLRLGRSSQGRGLGPASVTLRVTPIGPGGSGEDLTIPLRVPYEETATTLEIPVEARADDLPEDTEALGVAVVATSGDVRPGPLASTVVRIADRTPRTTGAGAADGPGPGGGSGGSGTGGATAGATQADITPPGITRLRLARRTGPGRRGATLRYALSEPAATTVTVQRRARIGRRTRFVAVATLVPDTAAGPHVVALRRRVGRTRLRPGVYRVLLTAVDGAGNRADARSRTFRIAR